MLLNAIGEYAPSEETEPRRMGKELQRAVDFLDDMLANGPVEHALIKQKAEEAGISLPTLREAFMSLRESLMGLREGGISLRETGFP